MIRPPRIAAFTLVEMITVIAVIAILVGLVLGVSGPAQSLAARNRAKSEIRMLSAGIESYKADYGGSPQDANKTDTLDPRTDTVADAAPTGKYPMSSRFLYESLTGDVNDNGQMTRNYAPDFFKAAHLGGTKVNGVVTSIQSIQDPFGNSYGYSTAGLAAEQQYRQALASDPNAPRPQQRAGYNPTFDLWSTGGDTLGNSAKWLKNW